MRTLLVEKARENRIKFHYGKRSVTFEVDEVNENLQWKQHVDQMIKIGSWSENKLRWRSFE